MSGGPNTPAQVAHGQVKAEAQDTRVNRSDSALNRGNGGNAHGPTMPGAFFRAFQRPIPLDAHQRVTFWNWGLRWISG